MLNEVKGLPGVFNISSKSVPTLFITAPMDPKSHDLIYLYPKIPGTGRSSQQQLWRFVSGAGGSNSFIENYASGIDLVIDVQGFNTGTPLQLYPRKGSDNANQAFYVDLV